MGLTSRNVSFTFNSSIQINSSKEEEYTCATTCMKFVCFDFRTVHAYYVTCYKHVIIPIYPTVNYRDHLNGKCIRTAQITEPLNLKPLLECKFH